MRTYLCVAALAALAIDLSAHAQQMPAAPLAANDALAAFTPFIGVWQSEPQTFNGRRTSAITHLQWGGDKQNYLVYRAEFRYDDGTSAPAFDGMITWDPIEDRAEFMIALGMRSGYAVQEVGHFTPIDGGFARHVTVRYGANVPLPPDGSQKAPANGYERTYMQYLRLIGPNAYETRIEYLGDRGEWIPGFGDGGWMRIERIEATTDEDRP